MGILFYVGVGGIVYFLYQLYVMLTDTWGGNQASANRKSIPAVHKKLSRPASVIKERLKMKSNQPAIAVSADKVTYPL